MKLFDAHIHWQDERLKDSFDSDYKNARTLGIEAWICAGTFPQDWERIKELSSFEGIVPAYGLHPWYLLTHVNDEGWKDDLRRRLKASSAFVGEIGLDTMIDVPWEKQVEAFLFQWRLALELDRPVIVHCRKAYEALRELIMKEGLPSRGFLLHSYSGSIEQIDEFVKMGAYFSVSGNITSPQNKKAKLNALKIPEDRILIETDAPAMNPFIEGKKWEGLNRPQHLIYVFKELAVLKKIEESKLSSMIEKNFKTFLGITLE